MTRHCSKCFSRMDSVRGPHCDSFSKLPLLYEWGIKTQRLEKLALGYRASVVYRQDAATIALIPHFPSPSHTEVRLMPGVCLTEEYSVWGRDSHLTGGELEALTEKETGILPMELTKNTVTGSSALVLFQFLCHTWTFFPLQRSLIWE